jgi:outer membrane protein assembly factor BamB
MFVATNERGGLGTQVHSSVMPPSVVVGDSVIYACQGDIFALDAADGTIQRRYAVHGVNEVAISGQTLYVATNYLHEHAVQALQVDNGTVLWTYAVEGNLSGAPVVAGDIVYASASAGHVVALRAADGALLWRYETGQILFSAPTFSDDTLYVTPAVNPPDQPVVLALDAKAGELRWSVPLPQSSTFPLVAAQDVIYISTYTGCTALAANDGALRWQQDTDTILPRPSGGRFLRSAPLVIDTSIALSCVETTIDRRSRSAGRPQLRHAASVVTLDRASGALRWRSALGADTGAGYPTALAGLDSLILVGADEGHLYALDTADGTVRWRYKTGGTLLSSPVAAGSTVYVGASDGYVYALRAQDGSLVWRTFTSGSCYK